MSRFYGIMNGGRQDVTRRGVKNIYTEAKGWDVGVRVYGFIDEDGKDRFFVYLTSGSNNRYPAKLVGSFTEDDIKGE